VQFSEAGHGLGARSVAGELELEAVAHADHRALGMTWSPFGILRAPSRLMVRGRLVREPAHNGRIDAGESETGDRSDGH